MWMPVIDAHKYVPIIAVAGQVNGVPSFLVSDPFANVAVVGMND
jgi:hypothetical protein